MSPEIGQIPDRSTVWSELKVLIGAVVAIAAGRYGLRGCPGELAGKSYETSCPAPMHNPGGPNPPKSPSDAVCAILRLTDFVS